MSYRDEVRSVEREVAWSAPKVLFWLLVLTVVLFVVGFVGNAFDLVSFRFWAPKVENAKREVFENTQGYVQGKVSYLTTLRYQYQTATGDQKAALRSLILGEASTVDNSKLPVDLQGFIQAIKGE